jgi:hypothetical protein
MQLISINYPADQHVINSFILWVIIETQIRKEKGPMD